MKVILTAHNKDSLGWMLGEKYGRLGWEVWLYCRTAEKYDSSLYHIRKCDISKEKDIESLLAETGKPDVVCMFADTPIFKPLPLLSITEIKDKINAKLTSSILFTKKLLEMHDSSLCKIIWGAGGLGNKPEELFLYSSLNSALLELVTSINLHYSDKMLAYYLSLNMPPTRLTRIYKDTFLQDKSTAGVSIDKITQYIGSIISGELLPGYHDVK